MQTIVDDFKSYGSFFVFKSTIFKIKELSVLYFFFQIANFDKKLPKEKAKNLCLIGQIVIESPSFLK